jgi:hypothetical protein
MLYRIAGGTNKGHEEIVELLLSKGADVNAQGEYYGNALRKEAMRELPSYVLVASAFRPCPF